MHSLVTEGSRFVILCGGIIRDFRFAILFHDIIGSTGSSETEISHPRSQQAVPSPITPLPVKSTGTLSVFPPLVC